MTDNEKLKMLMLGDNIRKSDEDRKEFMLFVIKKLNEFDSEAWEMFAYICDLYLPSYEIKSDFQFWNKIYLKLIVLDITALNLTVRAVIRLNLIKKVFEYII